MNIITRSIPEWTPTLALPADEIHIWTASLKPDQFEDQSRHLNSDEKERLARFRIEKPRNQFACTRGLLRQLLGRYLGCEPCNVPISHEATGKPIVKGYPLHFNVTHSDDIAAFAVSAVGRVGIDIEKVRPMANFDSIVQRFFSAGECAGFAELPPDIRERAFFQMWTRKEALLKALGQGIHALELCEISVHPDQLPKVLKLMENENCSEKWLLRDWQIAEGFSASVAYEVPQV